jgi:hypothetical protein
MGVSPIDPAVQAIIDKLRSEVAELRRENADLKARVAELEERLAKYEGKPPTDPSTPSGMTPPFHKKNKKGRRKKPGRKKGQGTHRGGVGRRAARPRHVDRDRGYGVGRQAVPDPQREPGLVREDVPGGRRSDAPEPPRGGRAMRGRNTSVCYGSVVPSPSCHPATARNCSGLLIKL